MRMATTWLGQGDGSLRTSRLTGRARPPGAMHTRSLATVSDLFTLLTREGDGSVEQDRALETKNYHTFHFSGSRQTGRGTRRVLVGAGGDE